jgi:hypothetical protein
VQCRSENRSVRNSPLALALRAAAALLTPAESRAPADTETDACDDTFLGAELLALQADPPEDFDGAFASLTTDRIHGLVVLAHPMFNVRAAKLVDLSARSRLPSICGSRRISDQLNVGFRPAR